MNNIFNNAMNVLDLARLYPASLYKGFKNRKIFNGVETYCMFIGYPRSDHSIVGALLDAHPNIVIAHERGVPEYIRSDNGSEFTAKAVREWLSRVGVKTLYIEPGSPWEKGYIESFNGKIRDELLNCEIFDTLFEAKVLIERWRMEYNTFRPHSSPGYLPPVPETVEAKQTVSTTLQLSV